MEFNHFDSRGHAIMVDISDKKKSFRTAKAQAVVRLRHDTLTELIRGENTKGDVFGIARLAGISAAKKTSDLIPLAHPLSLSFGCIDFEIDELDTTSATIKIVSQVKTLERTGVEMEAMTAVSVAALTIYDMCKGSDKGIAIENVSLLYKSGGKSGVYQKGSSGSCDRNDAWP